MTAIAYAKWIGGAVAIALYSWFWFHMGGESTRLKVATQEVHQEVIQQTKDNHDRATVAQEAQVYEKATDPLQPIAAPVVRMCITPTAARLPSPHPAGPRTDAPTPSRSADPPVPTIVEWNTEPLVRAGHDSDAQVAGLQDYITHVCQAQAP